MTIDPKLYSKIPGWMPGAGLNIAQHAVNMGKGLFTAATHPGQTFDGAVDAADAVSDRTKKALGMPYNSASAAKADQMGTDMVAPYTAVGADGKRHLDVKTTYNTVKNDPGKPLEDASMFLPVAGDIAAGGRAAALAGNMGRTAEVLGHVADATRVVGKAANPMFLPTHGAVALAKQVKPLTSVGNLIAHGQGMKTGVGTPNAKAWFQQSRLAAAGDGSARADFKRGQAGGASLADETLARTKAALKAERDQAAADYRAKKGTLATAPAYLTSVHDAVTAEAKAAGLGDTAKRRPDGSIDLGNSRPGFEDRQKAIFKAKEIVEDHLTDPNPESQSIIGLDGMKQKVDELFDQHKTATGPLSNIKNAIKDTANGIDPDYDKVLGGYSDDMASINGLTKDVGGRGTPAQALNKQLRLLKNPAGGDIIDRLAKHDPGLPYLLSGQASRPWFGGGMFTHGLDGLATGVGAFALNPHLVGGALLNEASSSPRLMSGVNSAAGAVAGTLDKAAPAVDAAGAAAGKTINAAGRVAPLLDPDNDPPIDPSQLDHDVVDPKDLDRPVATHNDDEMPPGYDKDGNEVAPGQPHAPAHASGHVAAPADADDEMPPGYDKDGNEIQTPQPHADGGRVAFARGGKIDDGHERLVNRLMRMAEHAKRASNEVTEPLLKAPDEHIVKALAIAQKAI